MLSNQTTNTKIYKQTPQTGAFILTLVLIVTIIIVIVLSAYLLILTNLTNNNFNYLRSEQSYNLALGTLKDTIIQYIASQENDDPNQTVGNTNFVFNNTEIKREVTQNINGDLSIMITATTQNLPRMIRAFISPPEVETTTADIALLIDNSASMETDASPNSPLDNETKLFKAIQAANTFVDKFSTNNTTRIGAIKYSTNASAIYPLTDRLYFSNLKSAINLITPEGSTNIASALIQTSQLLSQEPQPESAKYIILLTDGKPTIDQNGQSCKELLDNSAPNVEVAACLSSALNFTLQQANILKQQNIIIFSIGLGSDQEIDESLLYNIASDPNNFLGINKFYYHAPNTDQLSIIYEDIAQTIFGLGTLSFEEPDL